jgi:hypothetical protein
LLDTVKINSGFDEIVFNAQCDEAMRSYTFRSFGYNLTTNDFEDETRLTLPSNFGFYRTDEATLLKVCKNQNSEPVKTILIKQEKNIIDLSDLKAGNYWLCLVNYRTNKSSWKEITIY